VNESRAVFEAALTAQRDGRPAVLVTIIRTQGSVPRQAGCKMLVWADGGIVGTVGGGEVEALAIREALAALHESQPRTISHNLLNGCAGAVEQSGGTVELFIEPLPLPPTLIVYGCGHVGRALAELAKWMEFRVIVADDRPGYAVPERVPGMDGYVEASPRDLVQQVRLGPQTAVACLTRGLIIDQDLIPALLESDAGYIGVIGSAKRWMSTAEALVGQGIGRETLQRVYSPIGLNLKAETPKEIALSIMAEIVMVLRGGNGRSMGQADRSRSGESGIAEQ